MQQAGYRTSLDLLSAGDSTINTANHANLTNMASDINNEFDSISDTNDDPTPIINLEAKALHRGKLNPETLYDTRHTVTFHLDHFKIKPITKLPIFYCK